MRISDYLHFCSFLFIVIFLVVFVFCVAVCDLLLLLILYICRLIRKPVPQPQELVQFRKAVENSDLDFIRKGESNLI